MQFVIVLTLVGLAVAADYYKYDSTAIDEFVKNPRLISAYSDCFLGTGSCTREGTEAKKLLPEAIETACGKCTEKDKLNAAKIMNAIKKNSPEKYNELINKYDPTGERRAEFEEFQKKYAR